MLGGVYREMKSRHQNQEGVTEITLPLILTAVALLPLSMLGLDLRERVKIGLAAVLPGISPKDKNYRRSLDMDWGEYMFEVTERSGAFGPASLALPFLIPSRNFGKPAWLSPLGPTAERAYDLGSGRTNFKDYVPLYNQL